MGNGGDGATCSRCSGSKRLTFCSRACLETNTATLQCADVLLSGSTRVQTDLFLPHKAASRVPHMSYLPKCFTCALWVSKIEPLIQWSEDKCSRQGGSGWGLPPSLTLPSFQVSEMRRTLTPANSPVSSPSKHGDRFIPSRAGANWSVNFHRINVRAEGRGEVPLTLQPGVQPGRSSSPPHSPTGK